jgi:FkbM family methyltransferase
VRVLAYEPYPESAACLKANLQESVLSNVTVYPHAVAATPGSRDMIITPSNWAVNALAGPGACPGRLAVDCVSLEGLMESNGVSHCDLLKLDCEGAEYEILKSAPASTLRRIRRLAAEYHEDPHLGHSGRELCDFLESAAFRIDRFEPLDVGCGILCATNLQA